MLRLVVVLVIVHAIGGVALAGNWLWLRAGLVLVVWLLALTCRAEDGAR